MSTVRNPFKRRITAGIGIAALATAALFGSMLPASAADAGNIDTMLPTSLTIHKHAQPEVLGTAPNGLELTTPPTSAGLVGVTFKIEKVTNIDLSTNEGWADTVGLTPADVAAENLEFVDEAPTGTGGILKFDGLEQAVYLVTETGPGNNNIAFTAQPFLVTLPLPNNTDNTWIYDVHVYPKNSLASITKTVNDSAATGLGSDVTWNIAAKVPNASADAPLTKFEIADTLDSRLKFKNAVVTLESGNTITEGTHYTVTPTVANGITTVAVTFNADGLKKFADDETVNVALVTTVISLGGTTGIIENAATVYINDNSFKSDKAKTVWGDVTIHKVAANDPGKFLQGAEFKVYPTEADAKDDTKAISVTSDGVTKSVFTSDENGVVKISGLKAKHNGTGDDIVYYLVETKAPAGYNINGDFSKAKPYGFTVNSDLSTDITVKNAQTPPFTLPLTGGSGTAMFMTVGLGLLAVAGGVALRKRSTRRTVQA